MTNEPTKYARFCRRRVEFSLGRFSDEWSEVGISQPYGFTRFLTTNLTEYCVQSIIEGGRAI